MSDVIVVMRDGLIQQMGAPTELYERPVNRFVADFIGTSNPIPAAIVTFDPVTRRAEVETDRGLRLAGVVTDAAATPAVGTAVTVAIRPERLRAVPLRGDTPAALAPGESSVRGRVQQGTYLGDQTEYRIETDGAGTMVVRRQNAQGAATSQGVGPGDPVVVVWHEEANLILVG